MPPFSRYLLRWRRHGILDETIVAVNGDHGETLYEHECWFDHHGLYDNVLHVPLMLHYPPKLAADKRVFGFNQHKDLVPTLLELAEIDAGIKFDGRSLLPMIEGRVASHESGIYITECAWMRKHGWRTPQWKLILALEPDFHFKPPVELYNLIEDPDENCNLADGLPGVGGGSDRAPGCLGEQARGGDRAAQSHPSSGRLAWNRGRWRIRQFAAGI